PGQRHRGQLRADEGEGLGGAQAALPPRVPQPRRRDRGLPAAVEGPDRGHGRQHGRGGRDASEGPGHVDRADPGRQGPARRAGLRPRAGRASAAAYGPARDRGRPGREDALRRGRSRSDRPGRRRGRGRQRDLHLHRRAARGAPRPAADRDRRHHRGLSPTHTPPASAGGVWRFLGPVASRPSYVPGAIGRRTYDAAPVGPSPGASIRRVSPSFIPPARPEIGDAEIDAAVRVLRSGMVVQGPEVRAFEEEFSPHVGGAHCVAVNSGTSALHLALLAMGIGPGDEVLVPSFSFAASANAIRLVGADPVFVDIDPASFCLDPSAAEAAITPRTRAVMPVHLYGHPADMTAIGALAERHGLVVLEDAAQAHGAQWAGRAVGSFGTTAAFSFYPTKNMHSLEGGMVTTGDADLARTLRLLRNQGMEQRYANEIVGTNTRLTDVAAAIGRVQLAKLAGWNDVRRAHAARLDAGLADLPGVTVPPVATAAVHVYHQYTIRVADGRRDEVQKALQEAQVGSAVYYPTPIHRLRPFLPGAHPHNRDWDLPATERAAAEVLSLPVHPALSNVDVDRVIEAVAAAVGRGNS